MRSSKRKNLAARLISLKLGITVKSAFILATVIDEKVAETETSFLAWQIVGI